MTKPPNMPTISARQQKILDRVSEKGFVTIEVLAESFGVSAQTVRREIISMDKAGLLQRFHGGAGIRKQNDVLRLGHGYKSLLSRQEKEAIAERVASLISPGQSLFIDVGTTMEAAANVLNKGKDLLIVTNSMRVAALFDHTRHDINVLGGVVAGQDGSLVGEEAVQVLRGLRLDHALIGCSGIETDGDVMDYDRRKIAIKKTAMSVARKNYLLATKKKFGCSALARIGHVDDFHEVITANISKEADLEPSPEKTFNQAARDQ